MKKKGTPPKAMTPEEQAKHDALQAALWKRYEELARRDIERARGKS
jgi:hypothetical protein